jgi:hypothetical protein
LRLFANNDDISIHTCIKDSRARRSTILNHNDQCYCIYLCLLGIICTRTEILQIQTILWLHTETKTSTSSVIVGVIRTCKFQWLCKQISARKRSNLIWLIIFCDVTITKFVYHHSNWLIGCSRSVNSLSLILGRHLTITDKDLQTLIYV